MKTLLAVVLAVLLFSEVLQSQEIRGGGNPYSSQLMTDPDAGTVQGIQRYGRPMATDPAQGSGFPYFVFPSVRNPAQSSPFGGSPTTRLSPQQQLQVQQQLQQIQSLNAEAQSRKAIADAKNSLGLQNNSQPTQGNTALANNTASQELSAEALATQQVIQGLASIGRVLSSENLSTAANYSALASPPSSPVFIPGRGVATPATTAYIRHQPLVQIKLRVVEVARNNNLNVASTLDYISNIPGITSEFSNKLIPGSPNVNNNQQNLTGASRFAPTGLLSVNPKTTVNNTNLTSNLNGGAGALVNLTSEHINLIMSLLSEELQADVLTAPELVTINGESVEFVAGTKSPFNLGTVSTSIVAATTTTPKLEAGRVQNSVFYKHVGTYLRITPRIVNLGSNATGRGEKPIVAADVLDWNLLIKFLLNERLASPNSEIKNITDPVVKKKNDAEPHVWEPYTRAGRLVPLDTKTEVLACVNRYSRCDLRNYVLQRAQTDSGFAFDLAEVIQVCESGDCDWKPEDCTIDLEVLARFSNRELGNKATNPAFSTTNDSNLAGTDLTDIATAEVGVRAIANIVQIKNGTGVVMAGLLGESDVESVAKIPVLGDLPAVGFLFRAKSVSRSKSEIVIFIEAKVLSEDASVARSESAEDLHLAWPYVSGSTLDNPLETGLHRAGFGTYLPPESCEEKDYWERNARRVNRIKTAARDAIK